MYVLIPLLLVGILAPQVAFAQEIIINNTIPCFQNYTAGIQMLRNCGLDDDYLETMLLGWEWITGGYFSMILVSILIGIVYLKYQKVTYTLFVGIMFLPVSYFLFPDRWIIWGVMLGFAGIGALIWYVFLRQTKEQ